MEYGAGAVPAPTVDRDNAVLERHSCTGVTDAAAGKRRAVPTDGAVADLYCSPLGINTTTPENGRGAIPADGAVCDRDRPRVCVDSSACAAGGSVRAIPAERAVIDRQCAPVQDSAPIDEGWGTRVLAEGAIVDRQAANVIDASTSGRVRAGREIAVDGAGGNRQHP